MASLMLLYHTFKILYYRISIRMHSCGRSLEARIFERLICSEIYCSIKILRYYLNIVLEKIYVADCLTWEKRIVQLIGDKSWMISCWHCYCWLSVDDKLTYYEMMEVQSGSMCVFGMLHQSEEIDFPFEGFEKWNPDPPGRSADSAAAEPQGTKKKILTWSKRLFQTMTALSSLLPSAQSTSFCESVERVCITALIVSPWFTVFNSNRWPLSFVRAARSSQAGLLVQSQRVDIKICTATPTLLTVGTFWQDFKGRCSEEKTEIQQALANVNQPAMWYCKKQKGRPGVCHMVRLPFGACGRETAPTFNISQPLVCSGSLLPYSYSHSGLFIHEPPHTLPTNSPNLARSPALDSSKWVLSLWAGRPAPALQPHKRHESVWFRILVSPLNQAAYTI